MAQWRWCIVPVHQRHCAIWNLGWRLVHDGCWTDIQPLAHIADHSDDLGRSRLVLRPQPGTDDDGLSDGVRIRPVFVRHGLADDHGSSRLPLLQKPAGNQRNPQNIKIVRRDDTPLHIVKFQGLEWSTSWDVEEHVLTARKRKRSEERRVGKECRSRWS